MLSPDGGEGAETTRSFDVANKANDHHLRTSLSPRTEGEEVNLQEVFQSQ